MSSTTSTIDATDPDRSVPLVDAIRDAITEGEFAANQRLIESDLSERFGASRGNVRLALLQLTSEGLVERMQNRGARVRAVSLPEAIEITEVRMALEGLCAAKAAERATADDCEQLRLLGVAMEEAVASGDLLRYSDLNRQLDAHIKELSGQSTAQGVLKRLRAQNVRHQFRMATHPGRAAVSLIQHLEIIDALCARDPDAAEAAVRRHLRSVIETLPELNSASGRHIGAL
jgi:DNA-binding GntR family transcriptional regulator